jgi:hypothetical protein
MHRPSQTDHLPWARFWSPRKSRTHSTSGEFFEDPQELFGEHLDPQAATLSQITPETGLLVLCGEPGLGKTTELDFLRESVPVSFRDCERLIYLKARVFESFSDLQAHFDSHPDWKAWLSNDVHLTILFDGLDEGFIRMPTLVARLRSFLETKPVERLRLVLSCRSFEWPVAEGEQLASLWTKKENAGFIFELEPLRREDVRLAAEQRGHDGDKFLQAVHRADVASLASRPITLFFLLAEFRGEEFQATSRSQLYKNGCRRLCEENNPERAHLLRRFSPKECSTDEKIDSSGKLACSLLLGGKNSIWFPASSQSPAASGNVCHSTDLIDSGLLRENAVEQALGTGVFTALGGDCFGFTHQTFAECLAGQTLSQLPLPQLRNLLCATEPLSGAEYVIPQLVELAAWVAGDHCSFFEHLIGIDPAALLRSGVAHAIPEHKAKLVARILDLAGKNQFFDQSEYLRFWRDLDHPGLPHQLIDALTDPTHHLMIRRVAVDIAEACRRPELVQTLSDILKSEDGDRYFRSSVADALCASMPDDRLAELEPLPRGEVGPDPDQSILGHALQRLVPRHWSVADALPFIGRTRNSNYFGSYRRSLEELPKHLNDDDILPGLRAIQAWEGGFSGSSFRRKLCIAILLRGLELIDDPAVCDELVELWVTKSKNYHAFFRKGYQNDSDFEVIKDGPRRKWIAAIINASASESDQQIDFLAWETYRLIKPEDFGWILESLFRADDTAATAWANTVQRLLWNDEIRITWWDDFIAAYLRSSALRDQMAWFEETSVDTPARRNAKAHWLWHERRHERLMKRRHENQKLPDSKSEIETAIAQINGGESWAFINLCWALSLNEEGYRYDRLKRDITRYPGWENITAEQKDFFHKAARQFLLERSDGWAEIGAPTNYFEPGIVAIWLLHDEIESDEELRSAVAGKWIEAILGIWDSSSDHAKDLFALAYRINSSQTIHGWIREIWRDNERHGHPFAIRRAEKCFDDTLARELTELIKTLKDPKSVQMAIDELKDLDRRLAGELAAYLLQREIRHRRPNERMVEVLIIAGLGTGFRQVWRMAFTVLNSQPNMAKRVMLSVAKDADSRNKDLCEELTEDEVADFYLLLCRFFPPTEDPEEESGWVSPRRSVTHFRTTVLKTLSGRSTLSAVAQLSRLAKALPDQATWLLYRSQQTLSAVRRNEWHPFPLPDLAVVLTNDRKRIIRDNGDLLNLVLESLGDLQRYLAETTLPAVEDFWQWEGAGLKRKNFRHKDEEAVSDYVARWLRDRIGPSSKVVVNREVQPRRGQRTDILVEAWGHSPNKRNREEAPLSVTIEMKGCWNGEIKTGAKNQLLDGYLRPFGLTHGIFLVAWFHSPDHAKLDPNQTTELKHQTIAHAEEAVAGYVKPAQVSGYAIAPFVLDCRLR